MHHVSEDILITTLNTLRHLDVSNSVFNVVRLKNTHGGSCDVYRGQLRKANGVVVEIAIKRIRASTREDHVFAKVKSGTIPHRYFYLLLSV